MSTTTETRTCSVVGYCPTTMMPAVLHDSEGDMWAFGDTDWATVPEERELASYPTAELKHPVRLTGEVWSSGWVVDLDSARRVADAFDHTMAR